MVKINVIGCSDALSSGSVGNTCFYLESSDTKILIDCGVTSYTNLKKTIPNLEDIDIIYISHYHIDHYGAIPFILLDVSIQNRIKPLYIVGPGNCQEMIAKLTDVYFPGTALNLTDNIVKFVDYSPNIKCIIGSVILEAFPVRHSPFSKPHGFRINIGNKLIGYSGDSEWTTLLLDISYDTDIFICACNNYESEKTGHLNYVTLRKNFSVIKSKKILLTHFGPEMLNKLNEIDIDYAFEGRNISL